MCRKKWCLVILLSGLLLNCSDDPENPAQEVEEEVITEVALPQFRINTNGNTIVDEPKVDAQLTIIEDGNEAFNGRIGIEIRGSSSQFFPKKSYGFETWDENNEDIDVALFGYPEEEDWILYAPYSDKSLVRNHLIYDLSRDMGRYASRTKFVDVFINGEYNGIYVFMEKLKRDDNRIDINKLKDDEIAGEDLTGGYIVKLDKADGVDESLYTDNNSFMSAFDPPNAGNQQQIHFLYDDPDWDEITPEQRTYIASYMNDFESALKSDDFTDPDLGYRNYIDTASFIDFFLLNELSNNVDGYRLSTWIVKDKNEKLQMGPIWDFNLAFGNADYCSGGETNVWAYRFNERCPLDTWVVPFWWERLLEDPAFVVALQLRWAELRAGTFAEQSINDTIDAYVSGIQSNQSLQNNFEKWPVLGTYVWPNNFVGQTHNEEVSYLKEWIRDRLTWLDTEISGL
ncbi:CotH kinase family protein [Spongiivirga sp. MCCC 1A20706]|uniref:CotH kinase family protein n=1 Tax=Spongiivirga sp. MCCC 1A20706 TaxID=3160963 RepID=UPI0039772C6D